MLESGIAKKMVEILRARGAWALKTHGGPTQTRGIPDILVCYQGKFIGIEVKRTKREHASDLQKWQLREIRRADGIGVVAHDPDGITFMLNSDLKRCPRCCDLLQDGGCEECL